MDKRFDKIEEKLDRIIVEQASQHVTLKEHTRRSTMLEEEMKSVRQHVFMVNGAMKLLGLLGILAAIIESIFEVIKK